MTTVTTNFDPSFEDDYCETVVYDQSTDTLTCLSQSAYEYGQQRTGFNHKFLPMAHKYQSGTYLVDHANGRSRKLP